jgi:hypothetical protein
MSFILVVILILLILAVVLVVGFVATLGVVGVGWIVTRIFADLALFEASLITIVMSAFALFIGYQIFASPVLSLGDSDEDEWDEEEVEPPIVPWRRSQTSSGASSRRSKRKRR